MTEALFLSYRGACIRVVPYPPPPTMRELVKRPTMVRPYEPGAGELKKIDYPIRDYRRVSVSPPVYEEVYGL